MSNYIVKPESIARIANLIKYANFNRWGLHMPESIHRAFAYCKDLNGYFDEKAICKFLVIENFLAVDHRYKRNTAPEEIEAYYNAAIELLDANYTPAPIWENGLRQLEPEHYQAFKTLQCYLYQIDEDLTCRNGIYKSLEELVNLMSRWIIANTAIYDNCSWE